MLCYRLIYIWKKVSLVSFWKVTLCKHPLLLDFCTLFWAFHKLYSGEVWAIAVSWLPWGALGSHTWAHMNLRSFLGPSPSRNRIVCSLYYSEISPRTFSLQSGGLPVMNLTVTTVLYGVRSLLRPFCHRLALAGCFPEGCSFCIGNPPGTAH